MQKFRFYIWEKQCKWIKGKHNRLCSRIITSPLYNIDSLNDESTSFLYKKRLDEKLGEGNFESREECVKYIHQAVKEALGEKILRS